ncbi:hypothetical protein GCM10011390_28980 [Aureimonas endophytica]|uniref:Uncharacterized protein n=1 Tax=Aureimonas endophytica TaxID=2027858 RepID=A0A916ZPT1_9HYPH|nr:hypothetical protein [Aureimonas endophytica]GGE08117.1 hypothetical protein GCM10011390_28980 [Aureimonas endophytica]
MARNGATPSLDHRVLSDVRKAIRHLPNWQVEYILPQHLAEKLAELDRVTGPLRRNEEA